MALPFPNISPEIVTLPVGDLQLSLRWYALSYIAGLILAWKLLQWLMRRPALWGDGAPMPPDWVEDFMTWVILGVILGGRLGFVLFYQPGWYLAHPADILKVWEGGMSFHGGFLGVVAGTVLFCLKNAVPVARLGDAACLVAPFGLGLGRIANFINAELWGRPTALPWGVIFPGEAAQTCLGIAGQIDGQCARHPSQLYESLLEGGVLALLLWAVALRGGLRRPGLVMGLFVAGYGLARFAVEFVRQADAQYIDAANPHGYVLRLGDWGLQMGQILSLPMIVAGVGLAVAALRRPARAGAA